jgi:hypothetical protein
VVEYFTSRTFILVLPGGRKRLNYLLDAEKCAECLYQIAWGRLRDLEKHGGEKSEDYYEGIADARQIVFDYIAEYDLEVE